ncbi:MAG TPA: magnesium-translocating P-type ATPase [Thermomicrobiaceae bacterium]|nr:magnesium-translocating P-type ATPase [Thermomicrobiaceae bacterium]
MVTATGPIREPTPVTPAAGLSTAEAQRRLKEVGPNEPGRIHRAAPLVEFARFFTGPLVVILLAASVVAAVAGEVVDAAIIVVIVLLSAVVNFFQSYRSQQAADRLREAVAPTATVLRDGEWRELPPRELVPSDVFRLGAGDLIPADGRILTARDLHVQQAALTGESLPVAKEAASTNAAGEPGPEQSDLVFLGTSVVSGTAVVEVTLTGARTAFGDIAARLTARPPQTEFERGLRHFGYLIMRTVFFLVLFVLLVNLAKGYPPLDSLLFAIALAVGLTPEFLPMITTVTLAQGAIHMSRQKVIVKHLAAIQNLGSIDVLCSDKTGTLTSGQMALDQHLDPLGRPSDHVLLLATLNSRFETGIASPLDAAILDHPGADGGEYEKVDEIPFDFERRRLSVVVSVADRRLLVTKGAPEGILPLCVDYQDGEAAVTLGRESASQVEALYRRLSDDGYRVLAVASRSMPAQAAYTAADEHDLTLAGFLAFSDPPLPDADDILRALQSDGVEVKLLTGDNELVTRHVCAAVGLDASQIVLGSDLERMTDHALEHVAETTRVFARVSPAQKDRIMLALKRRGHVVGFLGDGINDAPSLRTADVGISVVNGTDIAKDAAEIILLERSLPVLHQGILEGRRALGNVTKYLLMGTSSNFGNMFSMAGAPLLLKFLPMLPTQILLNNFLYDLAQITIPTDAVDPDFIRKPRRWDVHLIRNFMLLIGPISSIYDFLTFFAMLWLFHASPTLFHTGWFVESLVTQTSVLFVIRTAGNPLRSRPSLPLTATILTIIAAAIALPFTPLGRLLGFTALPVGYFLFLIGAVATYLTLVEIAKRPLLRHYRE